MKYRGENELCQGVEHEGYGGNLNNVREQNMKDRGKHEQCQGVEHEGQGGEPEQCQGV